MFRRCTVVALLFLAPALAHADGMLLGKKGLIREESQAAFIEWKDGVERLYVATVAGKDKLEGGSLWIVPIPAKPADVKAEPVAAAPQVHGAKPLIPVAQDNLALAVGAAALLDTGLLPLLALPFVGSRASSTFSTVGITLGGGATPGVVVHQHIEKLGMTLEVLSADSTAALDDYLRGKELPFKSADLSTLAPYLKGGHVLICGWAKEKLEARAMRIDFPSPTVWFPLRPSQVYKTPIETSVYYNGLAELPDGFEKPFLRVEHVLAGLHTWAEGPTAMTRIILDRDPATWTEDVSLEPTASLRLRSAAAAAQLPMFGWWLLLMLLGGAVSWWLPRALCVGRPITAQDRFWAALAGFGLAFTVFVAYGAIRYWQSLNPVADPAKRPSILGATGILALGHFALCLVLFGGAYVWITLGG